METIDLSKKELANRIAGEITLSIEPGKTIHKWRKIFKISQKRLAEEIGISPSVISDYENGRRKSPGTKMVNKIITTMLQIDKKKGWEVTKHFANPSSKDVTEALIEIKEFLEPVNIKKFIDAIDGKVINNPPTKQLFGYTIIDSLKAIINLSPKELLKIYGLSTQRALIFTNLSKGRTPLVAIKVTNLQPNLVVLHNIKKMDKIALRIGEAEGIGIAKTNADIKKIQKNLNKFD